MSYGLKLPNRILWDVRAPDISQEVRIFLEIRSFLQNSPKNGLVQDETTDFTLVTSKLLGSKVMGVNDSLKVHHRT